LVDPHFRVPLLVHPWGTRLDGQPLEDSPLITPLAGPPLAHPSLMIRLVGHLCGPPLVETPSVPPWANNLVRLLMGDPLSDLTYVTPREGSRLGDHPSGGSFVDPLGNSTCGTPGWNRQGELAGEPPAGYRNWWSPGGSLGRFSQGVSLVVPQVVTPKGRPRMVFPKVCSRGSPKGIPPGVPKQRSPKAPPPNGMPQRGSPKGNPQSGSVKGGPQLWSQGGPPNVPQGGYPK
jgi:hypothetical protein